MIPFFVGLFLGIAVMGVVWAIVYNRAAHPGKVEAQVSDVVAKAKADIAKL